MNNSRVRLLFSPLLRHRPYSFPRTLSHAKVFEAAPIEVSLRSWYPKIPTLTFLAFSLPGHDSSGRARIFASSSGKHALAM